MPAIRKLPDDQELIRRYKCGDTTVAIAAEFGSSPSAVSQHWSRLGLDPRRGRHSLLLPWTVNSEHTHAIIATYLRLLSRLSRGEDVKDRRAGSAWRWANNIAGRQTVHYSTTEGFRLMPLNDADEPITLKTRDGEVTIHLGSLPLDG